MRKNYVASSDGEEERLEKIKDVLKNKGDEENTQQADAENTEEDITDITMKDFEDQSHSKKTKTSPSPATNANAMGSNLLLNLIGQGLARARKVPEWYRDEFVRQYTEYGQASMDMLGLNIGDSLDHLQELPLWQKYVLFGVISGLTAFFVIPIPQSPSNVSQKTPSQQNNFSSQQVSVQLPSRYAPPSRYQTQSQYIITPDTTVIQGMDGVMAKPININSTNSTAKNNGNESPQSSNTPATTSDTRNTTEEEKISPESSNTPATTSDTNDTDTTNIRE